MAEPIIQVRNVSKDFLLPHLRQTTLKSRVLNLFRQSRTIEVQHALRDISFDVERGEFLGVVGRNGSGKSTLLKILAGIYMPTRGDVAVGGKLVPFIELGVGFNPELTGRENVYLNGALLGFSKSEVERDVRRHRRLRRARGVHGPEAQELLLGHAGAHRLLGGHPRQGRHPAHRRGAGRRRRRLSAQVLRALPRPQEERHDDRLRHPRHGRRAPVLRPRHPHRGLQHRRARQRRRRRGAVHGALHPAARPPRRQSRESAGAAAPSATPRSPCPPCSAKKAA